MTLNGIVSSDEDVKVYRYFGMDAFSPKTLREAVANNPPGEALVLEINSIGGSVFAGNEIYSVLRTVEHVETRAEIQSVAASAASYLALACGRVEISPVAQLMMHLPSASTSGDRYDHLEGIQMLDAIRDGILNAYELKCAGKTSRAELKRLMDAATWISAQDAVRMGLADGILGNGDSSPADVMNAAGGLPDIAAMRAQYLAAHTTRDRSAAQEAEDARNVWKAQARLTIEKNRFFGGM